MMHTIIFVGEEPSLGNRLATILVVDPEVLFARCQVLTTETLKFQLEIHLLSGAETEAGQSEIVHDIIAGALKVLVQQVGLPAHWFRNQWLDYIGAEEEDAASDSSMDSDELMELENSLFGYPPDRGLGEPGGSELHDLNLHDDLPELEHPDASELNEINDSNVRGVLRSLFRPDESTVLAEIAGNIARPGKHYDRYLNYEDSDDDDSNQDDNDDVGHDDLTRM
jgi:hypothetical protein